MRSLMVLANPARALRLWALLAVLLAGVVSMWPLPVRAQATQLPDFTELVERVGPAVVNIRTLERGRASAGGNGEMDPNVEEFFRRFGIPLPGRPDPRRGNPRGEDDEPRQRGVGSGFILRRRRLRHDQRPRRRRCRRDAGDPDRQARIQGPRGRCGPSHRRRTGEDRASGSAASVNASATVQPRAGGRVGDGHRFALRSGQHRHRRHRQRESARHRRSTCHSSRPTLPSIPATPAAR
jgi:hypothetical protein